MILKLKLYTNELWSHWEHTSTCSKNANRCDKKYNEARILITDLNIKTNE